MVMNYDRCIGCKMCMNACASGQHVSYSPKLRKVFKCDLCGGDPKCAKFCPGEAIVYVDPDQIADREKAGGGQDSRMLFGEEVKAMNNGYVGTILRVNLQNGHHHPGNLSIRKTPRNMWAPGA